MRGRWRNVCLPCTASTHLAAECERPEACRCSLSNHDHERLFAVVNAAAPASAVPTAPSLPPRKPPAPGVPTMNLLDREKLPAPVRTRANRIKKGQTWLGHGWDACHRMSGMERGRAALWVVYLGEAT